MLIGGIVLGLVLGLLAGGNLVNLATIRLRRLELLARRASCSGSGRSSCSTRASPPSRRCGCRCSPAAFGLLLVALWANRGYPGMSLAFVGILSNAVVIVVNGGYMPIWEPSLIAAGLTPADVTTALHYILPPAARRQLPAPPRAARATSSRSRSRSSRTSPRSATSFLTLGLAFFLFAAVVRSPQELDEAELAIIRERLAGLAGAPTPPATGGRPGRRDRPVAGPDRSRRAGAAARDGQRRRRAWRRRRSRRSKATLGRRRPASRPASAAMAAVRRSADPAPRPPPAAIRPRRVRQHPYVRLALNGSFSALWAGQLISLFGDRLNQLALVAVVAISTGSALATGLVFFAATLPNLLLSPIAGTFVDRWDHKEVMVVSDILRAAHRPAPAGRRGHEHRPRLPARLPRHDASRSSSARRAWRSCRRSCRSEDLLSANSALWVGETIADVIGYPLAGLFVALLGSAVPLAFWVDARPTSPRRS